MKENRTNRKRRSGLSGNVHRMHTYMNRSIKVPQKGKVRIFLVILLIAAAGKNVLSFVADAVTPSPEEKLAAMAKAAIKREERAEKERIRKAKASVHVDQMNRKTRASGMSYGELMGTIIEFPPTLHAESDTIMWKNKQIVRYFTLDTALQNFGTSLLKRNPPNHGAMVILQPLTGRVLSLVSYDNPKAGVFRENLFLNGELPAASIFKTITAASAIEKNMLAASYQFPLVGDPHKLYKNQIVQYPKTATRISFADAYAYSVNPVFARIGIYYSGIQTLQEYAQKFGFNDTVPFELPVGISRFTPDNDTFAIAELASGFNKNTTLSPLLGALIAGGVSNGGRIYRPTIVDSVVELQNRKKLYEAEPEPWRVIMSEKGAATLKELMQATTAKGTARKGFATIKGLRAFDRFQHGGKTGNVDTDPKIVKYRVEWFVGFLKDPNLADENLACAVVQVHGNIWHKHSSWLSAEMFRTAIKNMQADKEKLAESMKNGSDSTMAGDTSKVSAKQSITKKR